MQLLVKGTRRIIFILCAFAGCLEILVCRNLRYEPAASLSERSLQRSEFDKTAHAFSRFMET